MAKQYLIYSLEAKQYSVYSPSWSNNPLYQLFTVQVAEHHVYATQISAKSMGWKVLSVNSYVGVGDLEPLGNALGIMLASPYNDR